LLPKVGGQEVLQALRNDPFTASIPVVSSLPQKNAAKLLKEGATAYDAKSQLELDRNGHLLLQIVKESLGDLQEPTRNLPELLTIAADHSSDRLSAA
jgi:CheY-like chemotaxis protein